MAEIATSPLRGFPAPLCFGGQSTWLAMTSGELALLSPPHAMAARPAQPRPRRGHALPRERGGRPMTRSQVRHETPVVQAWTAGGQCSFLGVELQRRLWRASTKPMIAPIVPPKIMSPNTNGVLVISRLLARRCPGILLTPRSSWPQLMSEALGNEYSQDRHPQCHK